MKTRTGGGTLVYDGYFADPFAWKFEDMYYSVGTGPEEAAGTVDDAVFPMLVSRDLQHWEPAGKVMKRPDAALGSDFWAPEVAFEHGRFYLYYSVGFADKNHVLRVAASEQPTGPYEDLKVTLIDPQVCPFAIDAHPFRDEDGAWYLFYARDFLDASPPYRPGTALMVARMKTMTELEDPGVPVLRARYDWQRFEANRPMYGSRYDWHTLEGPCVLKRDRKYYCLYSGGRWETHNYGVDYGVADQVMGPYAEDAGEDGPRVLRTIPGELLGPGHNSVVRGPDGDTDYIVYHAWDSQMTARRMFIDELLWTSMGPRCRGSVV